MVEFDRSQFADAIIIAAIVVALHVTQSVDSFRLVLLAVSLPGYWDTGVDSQSGSRTEAGV